MGQLHNLFKDYRNLKRLRGMDSFWNKKINNFDTNLKVLIAVETVLLLLL